MGGAAQHKRRGKKAGGVPLAHRQHHRVFILLLLSRPPVGSAGGTSLSLAASYAMGSQPLREVRFSLRLSFACSGLDVTHTHHPGPIFGFWSAIFKVAWLPGITLIVGKLPPNHK